jgi:hypothetical protein
MELSDAFVEYHRRPNDAEHFLASCHVSNDDVIDSFTTLA